MSRIFLGPMRTWCVVESRVLSSVVGAGRTGRGGIFCIDSSTRERRECGVDSSPRRGGGLGGCDNVSAQMKSERCGASLSGVTGFRRSWMESIDRTRQGLEVKSNSLVKEGRKRVVEEQWKRGRL